MPISSLNHRPIDLSWTVIAFLNIALWFFGFFFFFWSSNAWMLLLQKSVPCPWCQIRTMKMRFDHKGKRKFNVPIDNDNSRLWGLRKLCFVQWEGSGVFERCQKKVVLPRKVLKLTVGVITVWLRHEPGFLRNSCDGSTISSRGNRGMFCRTKQPQNLIWLGSQRRQVLC